MEKKYYAYMLKCNDGTIYSGYTTDIKRREEEHNSGEKKAAKYTRCRLPAKIVYYEEFTSRKEACRREWEYKRLSHEQKEKMIKMFKMN